MDDKQKTQIVPEMKIWENVRKPPPFALKEIKAGRLKGKTDINPQWRYQALTEQFGPCGIGWKYEIKKVWNEPIQDGQTFAFAEIFLYIKYNEEWSDPIPGIGGSMLIVKEKSGLHASDEAYKMAITDALSVACKMIGIAADIYAGLWDGSKYINSGGLKVETKISPKRELFEALISKGIENSQMNDFINFMKVIFQTNELTDTDMAETLKNLDSNINEWKDAKRQTEIV